MVKYVLCWLMLWQDTMVGGSIFQIESWGNMNLPLRSDEIMVFLLFVVILIERSVTRDFTLRRSNYTGPFLLMASFLFVGWLRGCIIHERAAFVMEAHDLFAWPVCFFIVSNAFRDPEEGSLLFKIMLIAVIPKCADGVWIWFFSSDPSKHWGVIQMWRDGYLVSVAIIGTLLFIHYRGRELRTLKRVMLIAFPLIIVILIISYRRTATLSAVCSAFALFVTLPKKYRMRHVAVVGGMLFIFILFVFVTDPIEFLARFSGVVSPKGEGSAYIRLMEWPNVIENIRRNPIFGLPVGVPWITYYRMPLSSVYTTLGSHNTYLFWTLRGGIFGAVTFLWLFGILWKQVLLSYRLRKTEEDFYFGQLAIQMLIMYHISCFFGLMYGDDMPAFMAVVLTACQLQSRRIIGRDSLKEVAFWKTYMTGKLTFKQPIIEKLRLRLFGPALAA
jgi:O-antigen ligase